MAAAIFCGVFTDSLGAGQGGFLGGSPRIRGPRSRGVRMQSPTRGGHRKNPSASRKGFTGKPGGGFLPPPLERASRHRFHRATGRKGDPIIPCRRSPHRHLPDASSGVTHRDPHEGGQKRGRYPGGGPYGREKMKIRAAGNPTQKGPGRGATSRRPGGASRPPDRAGSREEHLQPPVVLGAPRGLCLPRPPKPTVGSSEGSPRLREDAKPTSRQRDSIL